MKKTEEIDFPFESNDRKLKKAYKYFIKFHKAFDQRKDHENEWVFFHMMCMHLVVLAKNMECSKENAISILGEYFENADVFIEVCEFIEG